MLIRPPAPAWALALYCALPTPAFCTDAVIPKVEVAGQRFDQRREDTATSVVVGRAELERHGDRSLADALKRVAGITIGGSGRATDIRLRGLGNGYTQVLLDGVAAPDGFSLESLAPELIERVEIIRTASAELSAQSIAGAVNIVLRKGPAKGASAAPTTVKLGADRQRGAWSGSGSMETGGKSGDGSYTLPVTLSRTRIGTLQAEAEQAPGVRRTVAQSEMNAFTSLVLAPRFNWRLADGDKFELRSMLNLSRRTVGLSAQETALQGPPTRYRLRGSWFDADALWLRSDALWNRPLANGARLEAKFGLEAARRDADFEFAPTVAGVRGAPVHIVQGGSRDHAFNAAATYTAPVRNGHTWSAGWDGTRTQRRQTRLGRDFDVPGVDVSERDDAYRGGIDRIGLFVQDAWDMDAAWSVSAGWRGETLRTRVEDAAASAVPDAAGLRVRQRSVISSPLLQALYKAGGGVQWRAGISRTYKAPTLLTLIPRRYAVDNNNSATNPDTQGNPALKPEKAWGLDLGYDHYIGKDSLFAVSAYVRRIADVTVARLFLEGETWVSTPDNQGSALARGFALEAKFPLPGMARFAVNANLARNWSRVERIPGPDNRLDEQAPLSAAAGIDYRGALHAGASLSYTRGAVSRLSPLWTSQQGGKRALDVYVLWGAGTGMRLRLAATNLLERDDVSGSRYDSAAGLRQRVFKTSTGAALKVTLERDY